MSDAPDMPDDDELVEPSTDKDPNEEPKKADTRDEPEPSHEAVGIGVADGADHAAAPTPAASDEVSADAADVDQASSAESAEPPAS